MALNKEQTDFILKLDNDGKRIFNSGGDTAILDSLPPVMMKIKDILDSAEKSELDMYCEKYDGFYRYMKMLEQLANGINQSKRPKSVFFG